DRALGRLEESEGRRHVETRHVRRRRKIAAPQGARGARLWTLRSPRGATILSRRQRPLHPPRGARAAKPGPVSGPCLARFAAMILTLSKRIGHFRLASAAAAARFD